MQCRAALLFFGKPTLTLSLLPFSQSIVISGESGAGKSETAKKVLSFLAFAASRSGADEGEGIEARILASSPPLEAFGNAKTSMNNNSSRYGKFLMLQFGASGRLVGE